MLGTLAALVSGYYHSVPEPSTPAKPKTVLLANSIDYNLASDFLGFLRNRGMDVIHTDASNFNQYQTEKFIVILGGPDAYGGVGNIVQQVLTLEEQEFLRAVGNRNMYVKTNKWALGQVVHVIAGSDRNQTKKAHEENRNNLSQRISSESQQAKEVSIKGFAFNPSVIR